MTSFIEKLKGVQIEPTAAKKATPDEKPKTDDKMPLGATQLDVDIYQTPTEIIIYALVAGLGITDIDISIEGDNDVITIQGNRARPNPHEGSPDEAAEPIGVQGAKERWLREECHWGVMYRQIVLPQEVLVSETNAKLEKGVLTIHLPVLAPKTGEKIKVKIAGV